MAKVLALVFVCMTIGMGAFAQDPGTPNGIDPDAVPIDGGLSLLVAAGIGYGAKKMRKRQPKD